MNTLAHIIDEDEELLLRSFGMELAKKFREEIHSVSIHPDGLYVAVGFVDKIRFMNLLIDDMRLFQEFPVRESRICMFGHGGHLLAAAVKDLIHVYNTISFKLVHLLKVIFFLDFFVIYN